MNSPKNSENGRSIVEVLGVLAIVGILSIIGLHGYTKAMSKYHANELLNEAMKRATLVAGNLLNGGEIPETAGDQDSSGRTYSVKKKDDKQFTLGISNVDAETCELMQQMMGTVIQDITCSNNSAVLTFNNDLSTEGGENGTEEDLGTPETRAYDGDQAGCKGAGYQYCSDNRCITTTEMCPDGSALCADQYPGTSEYNSGGYAGTIEEKECRCPSEKVYSETDGCVTGCSSLATLGEDGTCTCKNGGNYPFCKKQCKCSSEGTGENACACADSLEDIVCGMFGCVVQTAGKVCQCASTYFEDPARYKNACACADSLDDIVCNDYVCVAEAGKVCKCAGYDSCVCADSLDQIFCENYGCIEKPAGQVCKCSPHGATPYSCACADSLEDIVCGIGSCIAKPDGKQCKCSYEGTGENACACADSLENIVCSNIVCITKTEGQVCQCAKYSDYNENPCACADSLEDIVCGGNVCISKPAGKECKCADLGTSENTCACADSLDEIGCSGLICVIMQKGKVYKCNGNGGSCAFADSLDDIVCGSASECIVKPTGKQCKCSMFGKGENACACADSLEDIVCGQTACTVIPVSED